MESEILWGLKGSKGDVPIVVRVERVSKGAKGI